MYIKANKFRKNRLGPISDNWDINDFLCKMAEKVFWTAWYTLLIIKIFLPSAATISFYDAKYVAQFSEDK